MTLHADRQTLLSLYSARTLAVALLLSISAIVSGCANDPSDDSTEDPSEQVLGSEDLQSTEARFAIEDSFSAEEQLEWEASVDDEELKSSIEKAVPPGGSWRSSCRNGGWYRKGALLYWQAECRKGDGSWKWSLKGNNSCNPWCMWNRNGVLTCGSC